MSYLPITKDSGNHDVVGNPDLELREQDRWLPIANVARLMKNILPPTAKVSKDAKECMQECVSEFISFITSEASDKCLREKRKTINGEDVLYSLHDLGFENYAEVLKIYLAKYREQQAMRQERGELRSSRKPSKKAKTTEMGEEDDEEEQVSASNDQEEPLNTIGYSALSSRKHLQSPDFFELYDGSEQEHNELGEKSHGDDNEIKHELDITENLLMHGKVEYQYSHFIDEVTPKSNENILSKLDGGDSEMDNLGIEGRNYF